MARRPAGFDLRTAIRSPSFTPSVTDVPALAALLSDEDAVAAVGSALARAGAAAGRAVLMQVHQSASPLRGRLARVLGRIAAAAPDDDLVAALIALLDDDDPRTRRAAITALGRLPHPGIEEALLARWPREERIEQRRALVAALGRAGGLRSAALLDGITTDDPELGRLLAEARQVLRRGQAAPGSVDASAGRARPLAIAARCRRGLETLLAEELAAWRPVISEPGCVRINYSGPIVNLWCARIMTGFGFPLPEERVAREEEIPEAVARALTGAAAGEVLATFGRGAVRYRIEWAGGGKRRAALWRCVRAVAAARPGWVNDPSARSWEVVVRETRLVSRGGRAIAVAVELAPHTGDPRFAWRVADVPAASHPTIAAALARVAGPRADDVVWDPFAGSGAELIERALLGPYARLLGTDLDERALVAARANLDAAGVTADLVVADATTFAAPSPTLILTNPPMGRRVHRHGDVAALLDRFVAHAARVMAPRGRLVWISPHGDRTAAAARAHRLAVEREQRVDMGGFWATLQAFRK